MDNSVQYCIRGSGIAVEDVIPVGNRKLAHDDGGVASVAVFYYFHQVKQLLPLKHLHAKVIQYEQVCLCYFGEELVQRTGYPCQCYLLEEFHDVEVHHFVSVQAYLIAQRGSEPALSRTGGACDQHRHTLSDVVARGEACDGGLVHTAAHVIVEVFQRCAVAEPGVLHEP